MEPQLQQLLDKKACEEVIMRYGRTLDWLDEAGQESCFWPNAEVDYGFFEGSGTNWVAAVMEIEASAPRRWHLTSGIMIELDGSNARSECYGITVSAIESEAGELNNTMFGGRYLDELEKRDGEWRISRRRYVADWVHQFPDGLDAIIDSGLDLNTLKIEQPAHSDYRKL